MVMLAMTKLEIEQKTNLIEEAYYLLYQWINHDNYDKVRDKYKELYQDDIESYNKKFDLIIEMYDYVISNIKADKERIEYYFKERNPSYSTLASLALLLDLSSRANVLHSYEDRIKSLTLADRIGIFAMNINDEEAANTPKEELATESSLISLIEASAFETDIKWEAIKIFSNQEMYYNEVAAIIGEVIELLNSKYSKDINALTKEFYDYWSKCQESIDIIEVLCEKIKISWKMSEAGSVLVPVIFSPFSIAIAMNQDEENQKDVIRIGIMPDKRFEIFFDKSLKKEDIVEICKLLSDKSKVDILELISKKPCYGKELANALGLSTATISYHVNALLKASCLRAEIISNKIYYSIDNEKIADYLDGIKKFFAGASK